MIIVRSPYRVSFFGGGSDYHTWYQQHGGCVLSTSIDKYCHLSLKQITPFFNYKHRVVWREIEEVETLNKIRHPIVREIYRKYKMDDFNTSLHHDSDLPGRSGIGSSSAFACAMSAIVRTFNGLEINKKDIANEAIYIEREVLGEAVGVQDQIASAFGGFNRVNINKDGSFDVKKLSSNHINTLQSHLLLFFTGIQRNATDVAKAQMQTTTTKQKEFELKTMMQMVSEGEKIMTASAFDSTAFGKLLHEGWMLKRGLTTKVTNNDIDDIYNTAMQNGAIGGKLLGAGSGGFVLIFADPNNHQQIRNSLSHLLEIPFGFETEGTKIVYNNK